jgi:DNA mismatch endonuclease, patch repair protein
MMARIRSRDTLPEIILRRALWASGLRYRTDVMTPGGRADLAISGRRFAVFIDGCFWHGCPEHYVRPRTRNSFWDGKLISNVERDRRQTQRLIDEGWTLVRLWEHEIRESPGHAVHRVLQAFRVGGRGRWANWRVISVEPMDSTWNQERRTLAELLGPRRRVEQGPRTTAKVGRIKRRASEGSRQ